MFILMMSWDYQDISIQVAVLYLYGPASIIKNWGQVPKMLASKQ